MAKRTSSKKPTSSSRKTLRADPAPYARRTDDPKKEPPAAAKDEPAAGTKNEPAPAPAKDEPAPAAAKVEPAPPPAKDEPAPVAAKVEPAPVAPPAPPAPAASTDSAAARVETLLPPKALPDADPSSPADPPGHAPRGDSRSLRRGHGNGEEFIFIYRVESFLITRSGVVGTQGVWRSVEYPSIGAAAHAYAQECSRLSGEGYYDLP